MVKLPERKHAMPIDEDKMMEILFVIGLFGIVALFMLASYIGALKLVLLFVLPLALLGGPMAYFNQDFREQVSYMLKVICVLVGLAVVVGFVLVVSFFIIAALPNF